MFSSNAGSIPVSIPLNVNGNNGGAFGNNGFSDIIALAVVAMIFGWGGYGYGGSNPNGQSTSVYEGYVLNNDFSQLSKQISDTYNMTDRKFEGLANGMCSMGYETQGLINGVNTNILTAQNGITNAITTNGYENRLGQQGIQTQIANCCCDLKQLNGETNYNIANQANMIDRTIADKFCQTNFNMQTNTRDIVDAVTASNRTIYDKLCQMESNAKDEKIADLTAKNFDLRLAASQEAQNRLLINELGYQCPKPAYVVQPPQQVSFATNCGGVATLANNGCGCNLYNGTTIA